MRIAVIGTGNVGATLGRRWAEAGHDVTFGTRDPASQKVQQLLATIRGSAGVSLAKEAVDGADVVTLATPWPATEEVARDLGPLSGRVLLDCTNPLSNSLSLELGHSTSGGEQVAAWSGARVVKIFNTTGSDNMADPSYGGQAATMFYCGDDFEAKKIAARLARDLGFDAVDAGPLANARLLEPLAALWIYLAYPGGQGRRIAFKLLRR
jgi:predicted dinucleotide-binding enzyme